MHETALLSRVVRLVEDQLAGRPECRAVTVRIRVSPWSHLSAHDARSLNDTFSVVSAGTRVEGAALEITKTRVPVTCPTCKREQVAEEAMTACTACGSAILSLTEEPEVFLQDIEVEEA